MREHSKSEVYYPKEGNLNLTLQNEEFKASEVFEANPYNKQLINLDRSVFTVKY